MPLYRVRLSEIAFFTHEHPFDIALKNQNTFLIPALERMRLFDKELINVYKFISETAYENCSRTLSENKSSREGNANLVSFLASRGYDGSKLRSMSLSIEAVEHLRQHGFSFIVYGQELMVSRLAVRNPNGTHELYECTTS
jgi:hypothetical protein